MESRALSPEIGALLVVIVTAAEVNCHDVEDANVPGALNVLNGFKPERSPRHTADRTLERVKG